MLTLQVNMRSVSELPQPSYECIHEEQLQTHSMAIERINAELNYKKERLDELKEDNKRMEEKLDDIKDCMNKLVLKSTSNDSALESRLIAIETKQKDLEAKVDENKKNSDNELNQRLVRIGLIISGISVGIGLIFRFI